jgi:hypothetical protein
MFVRVSGFATLVALILPPAFAQDFLPTSSPIPSITPRERFSDYFRRTYGLQQMGSLAVNTGIDYFISRPEWGRGMGGFSCGFASAFGKRVVTNSAEFGAASALGQDIRYRRSDRKGLVPRLKYAAAHAFLAYGPGNRLEPSYARFSGITTMALIEPTWHAGGLTLGRFGKNAGFRGLDLLESNVLTEFNPDLKRLSERVRKRVWKGLQEAYR